MKRACPTEEMIADYLEDRLSDNECSEMEKHLSDCDTCIEELAVAHSLLQDPHLSELASVPAEVTEAAVRLVMSQDPFLSGSLSERIERALKDLPSKISAFLKHSAWRELQPQPVRGPKRKVDKDLVLLKKTFQDVETEIEIEKIGDNKAHIRVRLLLDDTTSQTMRVTLTKGDREISSYLAERAHVVFEDVTFGRYSLTIARDGSMLGIYHFQIKETQSGGR